MDNILLFDAKDIVVSEHAYMRLKQRAGFNRKAADRMAKKVYYCGMNYTKAKGDIYKVLGQRKEISIYENAIIKIYGEYVFVFYVKGKDVVVLATVIYLHRDAYKRILKVA